MCSTGISTSFSNSTSSLIFAPSFSVYLPLLIIVSAVISRTLPLSVVSGIESNVASAVKLTEIKNTIHNIADMISLYFFILFAFLLFHAVYDGPYTFIQINNSIFTYFTF